MALNTKYAFTLIHEKYTKYTIKNKIIYIDTRKYIHEKIKNLLIHENTYTNIIASNTRIHDTRNFIHE